MSDYNGQQSDKKNIWVESILDDYRLDLVAEKTDERIKAPRLKVNTSGNCPRLTVYTNTKGYMDGPNKGRIVAAMDVTTFFSFISRLKWLLTAEPGTRAEELPCRTGPIGNIVERSTIQTGKDSSGIIYIAVQAPDMPTIPFRILPNMYHMPKGNNVDMAKVSFHHTEGYIAQLEKLTPIVLQIKYKKPEFDDNKSKGGYNKGGYNKGNYNKGGGKGNYNKGNRNDYGNSSGQQRADNDWDNSSSSSSDDDYNFDDLPI